MISFFALSPLHQSHIFKKNQSSKNSMYFREREKQREREIGTEGRRERQGGKEGGREKEDERNMKISLGI